MPACADVNMAMQELTGVCYNLGEQHKDLTQARHACDWKDTQTLLSHLQKRNPFTPDRNICTGLHAHCSDAILASMIEKTVAVYIFKRCDQVVTLKY